MMRFPGFKCLSLLFVAWNLASPPAGAQTPTPAGHTVNLVFVGDSITAGGGTSGAAEAPPTICAQALEKQIPGSTVNFSNQGHSGFTTLNFLPPGGAFADAVKAAQQLTDAHPGTLVFSIMLGTNDSANHGPQGAPVAANDYGRNLQTIIDALLKTFPGSKIFVHHPLWYSPNTHNSSDYEGMASDRLKSYFPVIDALATGTGSVFLGDTAGYNHFAAASHTEMRPENGQHGIFYLHPNAKGAESLGKLWANAMAKTLASR